MPRCSRRYPPARRWRRLLVESLEERTVLAALVTFGSISNFAAPELNRRMA
jgi:hypothetical protein